MAKYADLVARISSENRISKAAANRILKSMVAAASDSLRAGEPFRIPGMGTLSTRDRAERNIVDPHGHSHRVGASTIVHFSTSKDLKKIINGAS